MYHIFFIHSSSVENIDYFHILVIVDDPSVNIGVHTSFRLDFFGGHTHWAAGNWGHWERTSDSDNSLAYIKEQGSICIFNTSLHLQNLCI